MKMYCKENPKITGTVEKENADLYWIRIDTHCQSLDWMKELLPCYKKAWTPEGREK